MDCPKCKTWNPDDKEVCWRCQAEMPKPVPKAVKKPLTFAGLPAWMWVAMILFLASFFLGQCALFGQ